MAPGPSTAAPAPGAEVRALFPALAADDHVPLDNAATTHRPEAVLDGLMRFYRESNANVHRAVHRLGQQATDAYEGARTRVAGFLGGDREEVVFTRNATDAMNLVARGYAEALLGPGDVVVVTALEHHSNLVPWQQVVRRTGATLHVLDCDERGRLPMPAELPARTRMVAATRVSNALGTIVDVEALVDLAHRAKASILLDVTQAAGHLPLDAGTRAADFVALSAHKMYGPMGVGVLRGRATALDATEPVAFGGEMVASVSAEDAIWAPVPLRFEAGTPAVAPVAAFTPALDLLEAVGLAAIRAHEKALLERLLDGLAGIEGVEVVGPPTADERSGSVAMALPGGDVQTAAMVLDMAGVAVRAGWHCAQPLLERLGCGPTLRASLALYSTADDVDRLLDALPDAITAAG